MDEAVLAAARDGFAERIQGECHSMAKAGPIGTYEWWRISREFLDYLGALSVVLPDLDAPEVKAVLDNAAEAAAGGVQCAAYFGNTTFFVFLDYANFGMDYQRETPYDPDPVSANQWLDAFCLAILSERAEWYREAFSFARKELDGDVGGQPNVELVNGLMAYVLGLTGNEYADYPPSREAVVAAIDAALSRVHVGESFSDLPHRTALRGLRALAAGDQEAFGTELTELLLQYGTVPDPFTELTESLVQFGIVPGFFGRPRALLPLVPLALTALAYRREGWLPPVETDYLPRTLITGCRTGS
ncbi:Imm49 family immunity protein [Nocardia sp. NPDC057440]|uniref:Imm49 family immunity protein n=1 Tax=Nocardia sp. NPDC057440 TaxID=3346134 RepID=UPI0036714A73